MARSSSGVSKCAMVGVAAAVAAEGRRRQKDALAGWAFSACLNKVRDPLACCWREGRLGSPERLRFQASAAGSQGLALPQC